jgi:hypothetical protein
VVYGAALVGGPAAPRVGASLEEILAEPDDVVGERWAVSGEVAEVLRGTWSSSADGSSACRPSLCS